MPSAPKTTDQPRRPGPRSLLARFRAADSGVAAVEFALVLPIMIAMYFGMTEISVAIMEKRKNLNAARIIADLTGRATKLTTQELKQIMSAANTIMAPHDISKLKVTVSSYVVRQIGQGNGAKIEAKVCWSKRWDGKSINSGRSKDELASPIPPGFETPGSSFVASEIENTYVPIFGEKITGPIKFQDREYWPVRTVDQIEFDGMKCPT